MKAPYEAVDASRQENGGGSMNRKGDVTAEELGPLATRAVDELS
jgi:hypothetical protein